ncbi:MAG: hypothetical protein K2J77_10420 [Oscillospiraceae bacterium]|nr:hypothetical protein [Oscillospiraceae bacterium]
MIDEVKRIIETTYIQKNFEPFISRCHEKLEFIGELLNAAQTKIGGAVVSELPGDPGVAIYFDVCEFAKNDFKVKYKSVLSISKVADVYHIQHEFEADDPDPNGMTPVLDGFGGEPYCKAQFALEETIRKFLAAKGFKQLTFTEMDEVIPGIEMPENVLFGSQMTVEYALFKDMWGLCE